MVCTTRCEDCVVNELEVGCSAWGVMKEPPVGRFAVILERQNVATDEFATSGSDLSEARRTLPANVQRDHGPQRCCDFISWGIYGGLPARVPGSR
jgi:hypothetical protein